MANPRISCIQDNVCHTSLRC